MLSRLQYIVGELGAQAFYKSITPLQRRNLRYHWEVLARPEQLRPDGPWRFWMAQAGRGFGKTRLGAETVRLWAKENPGCRIGLVAETPAQGRDVMVCGESGLLAVCPPKERPIYEPSKRLLTWPLVSGQPTTAHVHSAHNFDELRGPQFNFAWLDELAKWRYASDAFDQLNLGLRLGRHPRCVITTTPRNISIIRKLRADARCVVVRGSTFDNADNLPVDTLEDFKSRYEGTRLGRQELGGELLDDTPGALWHRGRMIDAHRVAAPPLTLSALGTPLLDKAGRPVPRLDSIVVGVDPSVAANDGMAEDESSTDCCGIVVAGRAGRGLKAHYYVLEDATIFGSPDTWARAVVAAYLRWDADLIVPEENQGGALVTMAIRQVDPRAKVKGVHASRGKRTRAEPVSMMYEQGRVHHAGIFDQLEDQMCLWVPGMDSPDRMDAMVWSLTELSSGEDAAARTRALVG